ATRTAPPASGFVRKTAWTRRPNAPRNRSSSPPRAFSGGRSRGRVRSGGPVTGPGQSAERDEAVVTAWFDAFNLRDLDGMLERFDDEIEFRPLRFPGVEPSYVGHAGVREWFAAVTGGGHVHRIEAESFSRTEDGRLLVAGKVSL